MCVLRTEVDYCRGVRCLYLGECVNDYVNGAFHCKCRGQFHGQRCEKGDRTNLLCWATGPPSIYVYRAMLCMRGTSHGSVSVRPSQVGVLLKRLNG